MLSTFRSEDLCVAGSLLQPPKPQCPAGVWHGEGSQTDKWGLRDRGQLGPAPRRLPHLQLASPHFGYVWDSASCLFPGKRTRAGVVGQGDATNL